MTAPPVPVQSPGHFRIAAYEGTRTILPYWEY